MRRSPPTASSIGPTRCSPWTARTASRLWLIPFIAIAWANVHGSFPLVVVLVGLAWLDEVALLREPTRREVGIAYLLTLVLPFLYYTVMHGRASGQTLGKKWLGIAVQEDSAGGSIGYGRAFGRYAIIFVMALFVLPIALDYLWPLWDKKNQALHDKVVGSIVVKA